MIFKEAAYHILREEKIPLSAKEIAKIALKDGLITSDGKTPDATMAAVIYTDIKQKGEKSSFAKIKRGLFELKGGVKEEHEEKDERVKSPLSANLIIKHLNERQLKSDVPTDFE